MRSKNLWKLKMPKLITCLSLFCHSCYLNYIFPYLAILISHLKKMKELGLIGIEPQLTRVGP